MQLALRHSLPAAQPWPFFFLQFPLPSQLVVPVHAGGSSALATTEHVPVALAQVRHAAGQAVPQHVLSTQKPLAQVVATLHVWPFLSRH